MAFIELIFQIYFVFLLIRLLVPDTGQMAFNRTYQVVVKLTQPLFSFLGRAFPSRLKSAVPLVSIVLLVVLQGLLYQGSEGPVNTLDLGIERWVFRTHHPLWGLIKSSAFYLVFLYQFYAFLLLVVLLSPVMDSADQLSRLVKQMLRPLSPRKRALRPLVILFLSFLLVLALLWHIYSSIHILAPPGMVLARGAVCAAALLVNLLSVFIVLIIFWVILSWLNIFRLGGESYSWLEFLTAPFLKPFRRLGIRVGTLDFSPVVAIFSLVIVRKVLFLILEGLYHSLPVA